MASATTKAASLTTLKIGQVEVAVGLFSTVAKPGKLQDFTTAGPNGGALKAQAVARATPVLEQDGSEPDVAVHSSDPFAEDDAKRILGALSTRVADEISQVAGEYGRDLVEEGTGIVVKPEDIRRGVRLEDGMFIDCTDRLAEIETETKLDCMEVVRFVDITKVPRAQVKGAYWLGVGDEKSDTALRLLYEGLKAERRGAVVKLTKRSRQSLGVIGWLGGCLMLYEMVWAEDFRDAPARVSRIQKANVSEQQVGMMRQLIKAMSGPGDVLEEMRDDAIALREVLYEQALAGEIPATVVDAEVVGPEDEILAQLEASLAIA